MKQMLDIMRKHGFMVVQVNTAQDAKEYLLEHIQTGRSIGVGGSVSIRETEVLNALEDKGCSVYSSWGAKAEDIPSIRENSRTADVYLSSANAVTKQGQLVLVDGIGNRVAAIADGPGTIYFVIGTNKLVDGGYGTALARIKKEACPPNARRLGLQTPCADSGKCNPDKCDQGCMCRVTLVIDRVPRGRNITVIFVKETLGY